MFLFLFCIFWSLFGESFYVLAFFGLRFCSKLMVVDVLVFGLRKSKGCFWRGYVPAYCLGLKKCEIYMLTGDIVFGNRKGTFTNWLWLDFVGNTIFAVGSGWCVYLLTEDERRVKKS